MRRRQFLGVLGGTAVAPFAATAQQAGLPVVGVLGIDSANPFIGAFPRGLAENGFVEGRNIVLEYRWANNQADRLPALAADLVRLRPAVIATVSGSAAALSAKNATKTVPIVFTTGADPVKLGLVTRFNQPGGNITGVSFLVNTVVPKQFEVLHEIAERSAPIALLVNPSNSNADADLQNVTAAAKELGRKLVVIRAASEKDFASAFASLAQQGVAGVVIEPDAFYSARISQLATLANHSRLPAIYAPRDFAEAGGLVSYGTDVGEAVRLAGIYVGRILKGEQPADLPIQQSTKVQLVINLKTAKTLGLTIPLSLLGRADVVIE